MGKGEGGSEGRTEDFSVGRVGSDRVHDREGELSFGEIFAVAFVGGVLKEEEVLAGVWMWSEAESEVGGWGGWWAGRRTWTLWRFM